MSLRTCWRWPVIGSVVLLAALAPTPADAQSNGTTPPTPKPHLSTPLLSARRVPDLMRAHVADQRLQETLQAILDDAPPSSCLEVTQAGRVIMRVNGDTPLEPASTNKVLTATAVLATFKPDDKIVTTAVAQAAPQGGVITGNLWVIGGGDPILVTEGYKTTLEDKNQTATEFSVLADRLQAAGVTEITGDIVGDDSMFDAERYVPTWPKRYRSENTVGPLSALSINDGVTGYSTSPDTPTKNYKPGDPPALAAETLKTYLEQRGIKVGGAATVGKAPTGTAEVARLETTLEDAVTEMLSWSDNTTAEELNKRLGLEASGAGTTAAGTAATTAVLTKLGLPTQGLVINDGSGLDDGNRLTCDLLNAAFDKQGPDSDLAAALSIWGKRGTLRKKVRGTPLDGVVRAKTGTLTNPPVSSLAGFETTAAGATLTFSFVQNGPKSDAGLQDKVAAAIYDYPQAPDLTKLLPTPPTP